jgi:hypothetical protein
MSEEQTARGEIYFSCDIESDGPIPGPYSMLSFGAAAFTEAGALLDTFEMNLQLLVEATQDPSTMEWWSKQGDAYAKTRVNAIQPPEAMKRFVFWVKTLSESRNCKPVFVGYPTGFDFMFVYWYLIRFAKESPFSFSALDMKSFAMPILDLKYRDCTKKNWPKEWTETEHKHTHVALDDAIEQGEMFMHMLRASKDLHKSKTPGR